MKAKPQQAKAPVKPYTRRKQELIEVATRLFAAQGYHAVGVNDIGAELGLTGPAMYRHFPSKEALLVAVFDEVITENLERIRNVVASRPDPQEALEAMVEHHIGFVFEQTENLIAWRQEFRNLPPEDGTRLRRLQRLYVEEWVHTISELRPDLDDAHVRALAHAAIGLLQSPTEYRSGLPPEQLTALLSNMALAAIAGAPHAGQAPARTPRKASSRATRTKPEKRSA